MSHLVLLKDSRQLEVLLKVDETRLRRKGRANDASSPFPSFSQHRNETPSLPHSTSKRSCNRTRTPSPKISNEKTSQHRPSGCAALTLLFRNLLLPLLLLLQPAPRFTPFLTSSLQLSTLTSMARGLQKVQSQQKNADALKKAQGGNSNLKSQSLSRESSSSLFTSPSGPYILIGIRRSGRIV